MAVSHIRSRGRTARSSEGPALLDDLLAMAGSLAESRKQNASNQLENLADSMRQFSESLPSLPTLRTYAETAADSLEDLASYVLESDLPDMVSDARELARRHPLATFGGSVVAGLVITQLVQARTSGMRTVRRSSRRRDASPGASQEDAAES